MLSPEKIDRLCYDYALTIMEGKPDGNLLRQVSDQAKAFPSLVVYLLSIPEMKPESEGLEEMVLGYNEFRKLLRKNIKALIGDK